MVPRREEFRLYREESGTKCEGFDRRNLRSIQKKTFRYNLVELPQPDMLEASFRGGNKGEMDVNFEDLALAQSVGVGVAASAR